MVTFKELISVYWAQFSFALTLFFGLLGYIGKRSFDLATQKQITNHSLIQEHRIKAVNSFLMASTSMRGVYTSFPIYGMLQSELTAEQVDKTVTDRLIELKARAFEVSIFFPNETIFKEITKDYDEINKMLFQMFIRRGGKQVMLDADNYIITVNKSMIKVDEKMIELTKIVGETYTVKFKKPKRKLT